MHPFLTLDDAAEALRTTPERISQAIQREGLPAARIGRAYVLVHEDLVAWVRSRYNDKAQEAACGSISEAKPAPGGPISAPSAARALAAALAPRTEQRRRSGPPRLRQVSGGRSDSEPPPG
jgi:excisionase family DNA binding protein